MLASPRMGALVSSATPRGGGGVVVVAGHNKKRHCRRHGVCASASSSSRPSSPADQQQQKQQQAADAAARLFQPPPHSGYHFDGSPRRFFEGWYFKVDLPRLKPQEEGGGREAAATGAAAAAAAGNDGNQNQKHESSTDSLALIYSVEDPGDASSGVRGVGVQLMGPGDGYLCQFSRDTRLLWADPRRLALGACLTPAAAAPAAARGAAATATPPPPPRSVVAPAAFDAAVREGFQASTTWHQGRIVADESGAAGAPMSTVRSAEWCFSVRPARGWGGDGSSAAASGGGRRGGLGACASAGSGDRPLATAGWLSALSLFEPHWQVLVADGLATGWVRWGDGGGGEGSSSGDGDGANNGADGDGDGGRVRHFVDAPFYAEKNWGGGFPSKWMWIQCNSFKGAPGVSVTAVGARRALLVPGATGGGAVAAATGSGASSAPVASSALGALVGGLLGGEEDVGMIGIHLPPELAASRGLPTFLELVPWRGDVEWSASPWGRWWVRARGPGGGGSSGGGGGGGGGGGAFGGGGGGGDGEIEAVLEAECDADAGTVLRAPTGSRGLAPFCRDTFAGRVRLRVWRRRGGQAGWGGWSAAANRLPPPAPLIDVTSDNGALEVGGGPWVGEWTARAAMREPFRSLVRLPIDVGAVRDALPEALRPPGL